MGRFIEFGMFIVCVGVGSVFKLATHLLDLIIYADLDPFQLSTRRTVKGHLLCMWLP